MQPNVEIEMNELPLPNIRATLVYTENKFAFLPLSLTDVGMKPEIDLTPEGYVAADYHGITFMYHAKQFNYLAGHICEMTKAVSSYINNLLQQANKPLFTFTETDAIVAAK